MTVHKFRSRADGMNRRKPLWICSSCQTQHRLKPVQCTKCSKPVKYFATTIEARRYLELILMESCGTIQDLECQPIYPIIINDVRICKYVADFSYVENGYEIVEDVKPKGFIDRIAAMKIKCVEAQYSIKVTIVER